MKNVELKSEDFDPITIGHKSELLADEEVVSSMAKILQYVKEEDIVAQYIEYITSYGYGYSIAQSLIDRMYAKDYNFFSYIPENKIAYAIELIVLQEVGL